MTTWKLQFLSRENGKMLNDDTFPGKETCYFPANIYVFKVNNGNTRKRCEISSQLTMKTPEQHQWHCSGFFIVNFKHISHRFLEFTLLTLHKYMLTCYSLRKRYFNLANIILNRSNNSVFLRLKNYGNRQPFDLICASGIWMKSETLRHQASSSKF